MVKGKYGAEDLNWIACEHNGMYGVSLWMFITKGWYYFFSHIVFEVDNGSSILFSLLGGA